MDKIDIGRILRLKLGHQKLSHLSGIKILFLWWIIAEWVTDEDFFSPSFQKYVKNNDKWEI